MLLLRVKLLVTDTHAYCKLILLFMLFDVFLMLYLAVYGLWKGTDTCWHGDGADDLT